MKRDFASLNPQEALWVAVAIEERNAQIYENFASMFQDYDRETVEIFKEMAAEEWEHWKELESRYRKCYGEQRLELVPGDIQQPMEAPVVSEGELFIYQGLSMREALEVGLRAEREARDYYRHLAKRTSDEELRKLYQELADTEDDHERRLGNKLREHAERA